MAQSVTLVSGSIFNGNPIEFSVVPTVLNRTPSFHRIIVEVHVGSDTMKKSILLGDESGDARLIDVSSCFRSYQDLLEYEPNPIAYPAVSFTIQAYDEYMLDGEVHETSKIPSNPTVYKTLFGGFNDRERITSGATKAVRRMTRKPLTSPQVMMVGETYAYAVDYNADQTLASSANMNPPSPQVVTIVTSGLQTIDGVSVYALPLDASAKRIQIRFLNGFGVLDTVSVPRVSKRTANFETQGYVRSVQEGFNSFSNKIVRKWDKGEEWLCSTGPLDEAWLDWYVHEFLVSEWMWAYIDNAWLRIHVYPEDEYVIKDREGNESFELRFTIEFDVQGTPLSSGVS